MIIQALQPLQRFEQEAATSKGSSVGTSAGARTYDVIFDRQEPRLGFDPVRETSDGRVRMEVRQVTPNSMAAEGGVQVYDELVAYRAGGKPGAAQRRWHRIDFTRPTADFVQDIARVQRPLKLRFRRGSRMPGHTEVGTGTQAARQRAADQNHERARVAAAGFLTRPEPLQKAPGSAQRAADAETRGRRTAVLLCDTCLTKYLQMGPAKEEAERLKERRKRAAAARLRAQQAAEEAEDTARAEASSGVGQAAGPKPLPICSQAGGEKRKQGEREGKGRGRRREAREHSG